MREGTSATGAPGHTTNAAPAPTDRQIDHEYYLRHLLLTYVNLDSVTVSMTRSRGWLIHGKACSARTSAALDELAAEHLIDIDHDGEVFLTFTSGLDLLNEMDSLIGIPS